MRNSAFGCDAVLTTTKFMIVKRLERERQLRREKGYLSSRENDQVGDDATECKHKCKAVMFVRNKVFRNGVF